MRILDSYHFQEQCFPHVLMFQKSCYFRCPAFQLLLHTRFFGLSHSNERVSTLSNNNITMVDVTVGYETCPTWAPVLYVQSSIPSLFL